MTFSMYERLESFRDLEQGWYGLNNDGAPITLEAINEAKKVLDYIYKNKIDDNLSSICISPMNWGGIEFEIENKWEEGERGLMFHCPLHTDETDDEDYYMYEEPFSDKRGYVEPCFDDGGWWGPQWMVDEYTEGQDGLTYKNLLDWVIKKEHQCSN